MTTLLELKEKLVRFYGKYEVYITPIVKFIVAFAALMTIDRNIGYMELVSSTPVALILGLLCAILPVGGTIFIAAVVILADMYALSIEVCLVALLLFVLIYFIYFRFAPRQGMGVLLTPICFRLNIPYVIPVGMGLLEEAYSVFAVICGTVVYFFLDGVRQNEKLLGGGECGGEFQDRGGVKPASRQQGNVPRARHHGCDADYCISDPQNVYRECMADCDCIRYSVRDNRFDCGLYAAWNFR